MKIKLIISAAPDDPLKNKEPFMPLSLGLLVASAPNHKYILVDMLKGEKVNYDEPVDLVGISIRITAEKTAYKIADEFKKRNIKVVLGGPQASTAPLTAIKHADAVVIGEAELSWAKLLDDVENNQLKDFYIYSPDKFNPKGYKVHQINEYLDLKHVPIANRKLYKKRYRFDTLLATRGCPVCCDFCSVPYIYGKKIRTRPIDNVVNEIKTLRGFYYLLDDNVFGIDSTYNYYSALYDKIKSIKKKRFWTGQANLNAAASVKGREVIKKAAESGMVYASIGIESINPEIMKKTGTLKKNCAEAKKGDEIKRVKDNIAFIQDQGIVISGWFTIGYDEDTIDTYYSTLEFCKETNIIPIINPLEALPGTKLYDRLLKQNRICNTKSINILHPNIKDTDIITAMKEVYKEGFSLKEIFKRIGFYNKRFRSTYDKIFMAIFSYILQTKLKDGIGAFINSGSMFES